SRQLARVVAITLTVTSALYIGLAVVTVAVPGPGAGTAAPLAGLLRHAVGPTGTAAAAAAAIVLTLGATNAYINGAAARARRLSPRRAMPAAGRAADGGEARRPAPRLLAAIAASGLLLTTLYGLGLVSPASLVAIPTALFLAVYLGSMLAAVRVLRGPARWAAVPAAAAVVIMLAYCGWALTAPALVALTALRNPRARRAPSKRPARAPLPDHESLSVA